MEFYNRIQCSNQMGNTWFLRVLKDYLELINLSHDISLEELQKCLVTSLSTERAVGPWRQPCDIKGGIMAFDVI